MISNRVPDANILSVRTHLAYKRVLDEFGRIAKKYRRRKGLSIEVLAHESGVSAARITKLEAGSVAPYWMEAILLAHVYRVRVSIIATKLKRVYSAFAEYDAPTVNAFLKAQEEGQRAAIVTDADKDAMMDKMRQGLDEAIVDITIADWPAFLPPSLWESILAECEDLHLSIRIMESCAANGGSPMPIQWTGAFQPPNTVVVKTGDVLRQIHFRLDGVSARLEWLVKRHTARESVLTVPKNFARRIDIQRKRIAKAMSLIEPYRARLREVDEEEIRLADAPDPEDIGLQLLPYFSNERDNEHQPNFVDDIKDASTYLIDAGYALSKMILESA